jgi:hypothetical protein
VPPGHPTVAAAEPTPILQSNPDHVGAAALRAKQLSPVAQHPTIVVVVVVAAYDAVHVAAHE